MKSQAATIVVSGTCTVDDAIDSVNAGIDQGSCTSTGVYATNDTITIPAGTFPAANPTPANKQLTIQGAGMGQTILDMGEQNGIAILNNSGNQMYGTIRDLSILNPGGGLDSYGLYFANTVFIVHQVEIYANQPVELAAAIVAGYTQDTLGNLIEDTYIHDISTLNSVISATSKDGAVVSEGTIRRFTASNLEMRGTLGTLAVNIAVFEDGGEISEVIENSTFYNVLADPTTPNLGYVAAYADSTIGGGSSTNIVNVVVRNNTFMVTEPSSITTTPAVAIAASIPGGTSTSNLGWGNNIVSGIVNGSAVLSMFGCTGFEFGAGGTESAIFTSYGGNLYDIAASCTTGNDQQNVTNLSTTLGSLQNNGGNVPTIALLTGSLAIDAGVSNGLQFDQRGIARPQGAAYDSGAYELVSALSPTLIPAENVQSTLANTGDDLRGNVFIAIILIAMGLLIARRQIRS